MVGEMTYSLKFIRQKDFEKHVVEAVEQYKHCLRSIDLKEFNKNIIDPIKLLFDKNVFKQEFEDIIRFEIQRQRDKSNNNIIGYFHQNIFKYIKNCTVPNEGWDVIYNGNKRYYVEMKNKHNTMNSSSSAKTYIRFQNHLLNAEDKEDSICALVEVIAQKSQNIPWSITIDKQKQPENSKIRRISIDQFYAIVTGEKDAFKQLCFQLPKTIQKVISNHRNLIVEDDSVLSELQAVNKDTLLALYKLAFRTYEGFDVL